MRRRLEHGKADVASRPVALSRDSVEITSESRARQQFLMGGRRRPALFFFPESVPGAPAFGSPGAGPPVAALQKRGAAGLEGSVAPFLF